MAIASISRENAKALLDFCRKHGLNEFFFAVDHGAYFGANVGKHGTESFAKCIHFLEGCDPDKDEEDWYDNAHTRFGGDDVGEFLPVTWLAIICERPEYSNKKMFSVNFGKRQVKLIT